MSVKGIDVSAWQVNIDWNKVKTEIDFAIIRLGFGTKTLDNQAKRNISELNRLGIPYGVYWFSYAYTEEMAKQEAKSAVAYLKELGAKLSYPVYFDWEYDSRNYAAKNGVNVSKTLLCNMATAFCEEVKAAGYYPGIYANPDYIENYFGKEIFEKYDLWVAHYASKTSYEANIWQYSSKGRVAGIDGNVDMNNCYVDYPAIVGSNAPAPEKTPAKVPEKTPENKEVYYTMKMRHLRNSHTGEDVRALQILLIGRGYSCGADGADGIFGAATEKAVRKYQKDTNKVEDGIAGPDTMGGLMGAA